MGRLGISLLQGKSIAAMTASDNKILEHEPYPDPFILFGNILKDHTHGVKTVLEILKKKSKKKFVLSLFETNVLVKPRLHGAENAPFFSSNFGSVNHTKLKPKRVCFILMSTRPLGYFFDSMHTGL